MSALAQDFAARHFNFGTENEMAYALDADLQVVRDVLEELRTDYYGDRACWCSVHVRRPPSTIQHTAACDSAAELLDRLRM